jgi:hypothetical protein
MFAKHTTLVQLPGVDHNGLLYSQVIVYRLDAIYFCHKLFSVRLIILNWHKYECEMNIFM